MLLIIQVLSASILAVSAPSLLSNYFGSGVAAVIGLVPLGAGICLIGVRLAAFGNPGHQERAQIHWLIVMLFAAFAIGLLGAIVQAGTWGTMQPTAVILECTKWVCVATLLVISRIQFASDKWKWLVSILVYPLLAFAIANVVLLLAGVENANVLDAYLVSRGDALMLGFSGIDLQREALPLGNGVNVSGLQAGLGIAVGGTLLMVSGAGRKRWAGALLFLISIYCVLLTDSRSGFLAGCLAPAGVMVMRQRIKFVALPVLVVAAVLPWLASWALVDATAVTFASENTMTRGDDLFTGRPLLWQATIARIGQLDPRLIIGYGVSGQIPSGIADDQAQFVASWASNPDTAGSHNEWLQAVVERGYFGALIEFVLLAMVIVRTSRSTNPASLVSLSATIYLILISATDEIASLSSPVTLFALFVVAISSFSIDSAAQQRSLNERQPGDPANFSPRNRALRPAVVRTPTAAT